MSLEPGILEIDPGWRLGIEDMGSKPKFWFRYEDANWLFKQARANTGEHWAEKIASEIASRLKLPTHEVRIARFEARIGCAVRSFLKRNEVLVHGNELLAGMVEGYDKDKWRGQAEHNFDNIVYAIEKLFPEDWPAKGYLSAWSDTLSSMRSWAIRIGTMRTGELS